MILLSPTEIESLRAVLQEDAANEDESIRIAILCNMAAQYYHRAMQDIKEGK